MESFDGGNTWTYKKVYDCNFENDKPALIARGVAAAIDANDAVHIAFNAILVDNHYWYTFDGGIIYWKSTKEVLTQASFGIEYEKTGDEFNITKLGYLKYPNFIYHPELLGYDYWTVWPGATPEMAAGYNKQGTVYNPRMVVEDGKVFLSYGSIIEQPNQLDILPSMDVFL